MENQFETEEYVMPSAALSEERAPQDAEEQEEAEDATFEEDGFEEEDELEGDEDLQDGKWIERFDNGHTKFTGYYQHGKPVGTWEEYYDNGKIKAISNYAIIKDDIGSLKSCLSGSYQEYYKTGRLKTVGFYAAVPQSVSETVKVQDPVSGVTKEVVTKSVTYQPEKVGHWEQYDENGETEKKED